MKHHKAIGATNDESQWSDELIYILFVTVVLRQPNNNALLVLKYTS